MKKLCTLLSGNILCEFTPDEFIEINNIGIKNFFIKKYNIDDIKSTYSLDFLTDFLSTIFLGKQLEPLCYPDNVNIQNFVIYIEDILNNQLSETERKIIEFRLGAYDFPLSRAKIGNILNLHLNKITGIENKIYRKLRHPYRSRKLREFVDMFYPNYFSKMDNL